MHTVGGFLAGVDCSSANGTSWRLGVHLTNQKKYSILVGYFASKGRDLLCREKV